MNIIFGWASTIGLRDENQDNMLSMVGDRMSIFAIADGAGGHAYGKKASKMALEAIAREFSHCDSYDTDYLTALIKMKYNQINSYILEAQKELNAIMGTTLSMLNILSSNIIVSNVGDTKIFRIRDKDISMISQVHTVAWDSYRRGEIGYEDIDRHPQSHVLSKALGVRGNLEPYIHVMEHKKEDYYIICSDGVYNFVSPYPLMDMILNSPNRNSEDLNILCKNILRQALENGSSDNASIIIIKWDNKL